MNDAVKPLGAREKLALSRAQLLAVMGFQEVKDTVGTLVVQALPKPQRSGLIARIGSSVVGQWWRRHPINSVAALAQPVLEGYARRSPGKLVACSAGLGCLLVVLKPWKLLSVGAVFALLFKGSDIVAMVTGALNTSGFDTSQAREPHPTATTAIQPN